MGASYIHASAEFSACGTYRYALTRTMGLWLDNGTVLFVGLNPSTATAETDDPTIRRCVAFARRWGYGRYVMANLHALRSTDPKGLRLVDDPVGPENAARVLSMADDADLVICAWGANWLAPGAIQIASTLRQHPKARHLGLTKDGHPKHPLYLSGSTEPQEF